MAQEAKKGGVGGEPLTTCWSVGTTLIARTNMGHTPYDDRNRGVLFRVDDEKKVERAPDYSGNIDVGGVKYWLSAWVRTSRKGKKFFSLALTPQQEQVDRSKPLREALHDEIPF